MDKVTEKYISKYNKLHKKYSEHLTYLEINEMLLEEEDKAFLKHKEESTNEYCNG